MPLPSSTSQTVSRSAFGWRDDAVICETITLSIFAPRVSIFSVSTPARVSNSAISSAFFGRSTNSRSQLTENFILSGSARVSRVGFGVSPKQSFEKFAIARRNRRHARGVRYPEQKSLSCELEKEPQIVLREQADVGDIEQDHGKPVHAQTEGEAGPLFGI